MPTLNLNHPTSTSSPLISTPEPIVRSNAYEVADHQESISPGEPKSSDIVYETVLSTQEPNLDGEGIHIGVYPNDTITNTGLSRVFTSDPLIEGIVTPPTGVIRDPVETMSSQTLGNLGDLHTMQMASPRESSVIQRLSPREINATIHPSVIDDSSEKMDEEITIEGPTTISGVPNSNFFQQWLQPIQHDWEAGPSTVPLLSKEELTDLYGEQMDGLYQIAQQLLTSKMPNKDYAAIMLQYVKDVDDVQEKVAEDIETGKIENVDAWLIANHSINL